MTTLIDFQAYTSPARMDSNSGALVGIKLIKAAPEDPSMRLRAALAAIRAGTVRIQEVRAARSRILKPENVRPYDQRFDGGWGGLHGMLAGLARFGGTPEAERAKNLITSLFANGLGFLTLSFEAEWLHGQVLLQRVDDEGLAEEITALTHPIALPYVREATSALGEALGLGEKNIEPPLAASLADAIDAQSTAVAKYMRVLAGETDDDDPSSVARFLKAAAPIDWLRAYHARSPKPTAEGPSEDSDPDAPVPPTPGEARDGQAR